MLEQSIWLVGTPVVQEELLVDVYGLLVVRAQVVYGGQAQLVLAHVPQRAVPLHQQRLVPQLVCEVKQQPVLQHAVNCLKILILITSQIIIFACQTTIPTYLNLIISINEILFISRRKQIRWNNNNTWFKSRLQNDSQVNVKLDLFPTRKVF